MTAPRAIATFFLTCALFLAVLEGCVYWSARDAWFLASVIELRKGQADCVVLGDSHTGAAFRGELPACVNLSLGGVSVAMLADGLDSVRTHNELTHVIVVLAPHLFAEPRSSRYDTGFQGLAGSNSRWSSLSLLMANPIIRHATLLSLRDQLLGKTGGDTAVSSTWAAKGADQIDQLVADKVVNQVSVLPVDFEPTLNAYLALLDRLRADNVAVCAVRPPVDPRYDEALLTRFGHEAWNHIVQRVRDKGVQVVDAPIFESGEIRRQLSNQDHLNSLGAREYAPRAWDLCFT